MGNNWLQISIFRPAGARQRGEAPSVASGRHIQVPTGHLE